MSTRISQSERQVLRVVLKLKGPTAVMRQLLRSRGGTFYYQNSYRSTHEVLLRDGAFFHRGYLQTHKDLPFTCFTILLATFGRYDLFQFLVKFRIIRNNNFNDFKP